MTLTSVYLVAAGMVAAALWLYYLVVRDNAVKRPHGAVQWVAATLSALAVVLAVTLVMLAQRPPSAPAQAVTAASGEENMPRPSPEEMDVAAENFAYRLVETDAEMDLATLEGQVVLLNFWATWCPPCLEEIPHLNRLQQTYMDSGLVVLTVSDEAREDLVTSDIAASLQTISGYLPDTSALPQPFHRTLEVRPTSYVIDRDGRLREYLLGGRDYASFERAVLPYL